MAGRPVKFMQTRQALAMARRLSQAGMGVFAALRRSDGLAFPAHAVEALCAPTDTNAALKALLNRNDSGAAPGKRHRASAPRLGDPAKSQTPKDRSTLAPVAKRPKRPVASAKPESVRAVPPAFDAPQAKTKPVQQIDAAAAKPAQSVAKQTAHVPKSRKDIVEFRRLQRRGALDVQTQAETANATHSEAATSPSHETGVEGAAFASLAEFTRAKAVASLAERASNARPLLQDSSPTSQTLRPVSSGAVDPEHIAAAQLVLPEPSPKQNALGYDDVAPTVSARTDAGTVSPKTGARKDRAVPQASVGARPALEPARPKTRSSDLRLSDGGTATGEAAWRNGVEPQ